MKRNAPPCPTPEELHRGSPWWWAICEHCSHSKPMALVPLIIRWGPGTSSDLLRQSAPCSKCGRKGACLQTRGWGGSTYKPRVPGQ